jgi:hypothetical protein
MTFLYQQFWGVGVLSRARPGLSSPNADFFSAHPEYAWMDKFLGDMKSFPWTLFEAKK